MNRNMVIIFTITVILSIFTRIASNYTGSIMGDLIFGILRGFTIAAFANTVINSVIRIWERFRQSLYKDESYLIHTLPVSKKKLYDSKTISGIGTILLSLVVVITCFFIVIFGIYILTCTIISISVFVIVFCFWIHTSIYIILPL